MLSIGEIAHFTGVSRRMLRHWEQVGLISPAAVDTFTGYRRYARTQVGQIRAISTLRSVGFTLAEIIDLLDHAQLTEARLIQILRVREHDLVAQVDEASARLTEVRKRLEAIKKGRDTIMRTIELEALPALRLLSLQATVRDESEIGEAISGLLPRLRDELGKLGVTDSEIVLTYDGGTDPDTIAVTVGTEHIDTQGHPNWRWSRSAQPIQGSPSASMTHHPTSATRGSASTRAWSHTVSRRQGSTGRS